MAYAAFSGASELHQKRLIFRDWLGVDSTYYAAQVVYDRAKVLVAKCAATDAENFATKAQHAAGEAVQAAGSVQDKATTRYAKGTVEAADQAEKHAGDAFRSAKRTLARYDDANRHVASFDELLRGDQQFRDLALALDASREARKLDATVYDEAPCDRCGREPLTATFSTNSSGSRCLVCDDCAAFNATRKRLLRDVTRGVDGAAERLATHSSEGAEKLRRYKAEATAARAALSTEELEEREALHRRRERERAQELARVSARPRPALRRLWRERYDDDRAVDRCRRILRQSERGGDAAETHRRLDADDDMIVLLQEWLGAKWKTIARAVNVSRDGGRDWGLLAVHDRHIKLTSGNQRTAARAGRPMAEDIHPRPRSAKIFTRDPHVSTLSGIKTPGTFGGTSFAEARCILLAARDAASPAAAAAALWLLEEHATRAVQGLDVRTTSRARPGDDVFMNDPERGSVVSSRLPYFAPGSWQVAAHVFLATGADRGVAVVPLQHGDGRKGVACAIVRPRPEDDDDEEEKEDDDEADCPAVNQTPTAPPAPVPRAEDDDEDAGPRLIIASHEFSAAQANYVALRHPENPRAPIFYKGARPFAEHYVRCGVRVEGVNHGVAVPVKIELCFPDGRVVQSKFETRSCSGRGVEVRELESLKVLGDGAKRLTLPNTGAVVYFDYRIELLSLRADNRKFCVKVSPDASHVAGVLPAIAPGLLVMSEKPIAKPIAEPAPQSGCVRLVLDTPRLVVVRRARAPAPAPAQAAATGVRRSTRAHAAPAPAVAPNGSPEAYDEFDATDLDALRGRSWGFLKQLCDRRRVERPSNSDGGPFRGYKDGYVGKLHADALAHRAAAQAAAALEAVGGAAPAPTPHEDEEPAAPPTEDMEVSAAPAPTPSPDLVARSETPVTLAPPEEQAVPAPAPAPDLPPTEDMEDADVPLPVPLPTAPGPQGPPLPMPPLPPSPPQSPPRSDDMADSTPRDALSPPPSDEDSPPPPPPLSPTGSSNHDMEDAQRLDAGGASDRGSEAGADDAAGDGSQPSFCFPPSSGARDGSETADDAAASGYEADSDGDGDVSSANNAPRRIEHPCPGCHADDVRGASNELDHLVDGLLGNPVHPQCRLRALFFM